MVVRQSPVGPNGRGGQPLWATAVADKPPCATAARPTTVAHGGRARAVVVAYGGRFAALYISRKLARKCHKNSRKKKERVGKERGGE
jgi:hypothetical protein